MNKKRAKITLTLFALLVLCAVFIIVRTRGPGGNADTLTSTLSLEDIQNAPLILEGKALTFADFSTPAKGLPGDKGTGCIVSLRQDMVAFGDINNDQKGDAAGVVGVDCSVGRHDVYLVVWTGLATKAESGVTPIGSVLLGERIPVFSIQIKNGQIDVSRGAEYGGTSSVALQKTSAFIVESGKVKESTQAGENVTTLPPDDWKNYTSDKYGFSFFYPSDWGTVKEFVEKGSCPAGVITAKDPCIHISLAFSDVKGSGIFLSTATNLYAKYPNKNRGGYWGDAALSIKSKEYLYGFCGGHTSVSCGLINNSFGAEYLRYHDKGCINDSDGACDKSVLYYYVKSPNPVFYSALLSDAYLLNVTDSRVLMEQMMATFRFLAK
jgi:hypothetical protein